MVLTRSVVYSIILAMSLYGCDSKEKAQERQDKTEKMLEETVSGEECDPGLRYRLPKKLSFDGRDFRFEYSDPDTKEKVQFYYGVIEDYFSLSIKKENGAEFSVNSFITQGKREEFYSFTNRERYLLFNARKDPDWVYEDSDFAVGKLSVEEKRQMVFEAEERFNVYMNRFSGIVTEVQSAVLKYKSAVEEFKETKKKFNIKTD